jgi:CrcB protein
MGVVGGYTTFSTYAQETLDLMEEGKAGVALLYAVGSAVLGVAAVVAGMRMGRVL